MPNKWENVEVLTKIINFILAINCIDVIDFICVIDTYGYSIELFQLQLKLYFKASDVYVYDVEVHVINWSRCYFILLKVLNLVQIFPSLSFNLLPFFAFFAGNISVKVIIEWKWSLKDQKYPF
jgi:hypothetical protein